MGREIREYREKREMVDVLTNFPEGRNLNGQRQSGQRQRPTAAPTLVFTNEAGQEIPHVTIEHRFARVLESAGIQDHRFHDLRHPYVKPTTKKFITFFEVFRAAS